MADIVINDAKYAKGKLSLSRRDMGDGEVEITGVLSVHRYFEEIIQIETRRYFLGGVKVVQEDFGSDDHQIMYVFTAKTLIVKGCDELGESPFDDRTVEEIEEELYPGEDINKRGDTNGGEQS